MSICYTKLNIEDRCLNSSYLTYNEYKNENFKNNLWILCFTFFSILIFDIRVDIIKKVLSKLFSEDIETYILSKLLSLLCLIISIIISPIILIIFTICFIYRNTVHYILKYNQKNYIELLEGTDAVWAIEDVSKSVINILSIIEITNIHEFKEKLTETLLNIIKNEKYAKLKYSRHQKYGYYYWSSNNNDINKQIKYLPTTDNLNKQKLLEIISQYSNTELPNNHTSSWEILIGQQKLENNYPVLFRFHHSVGDGLALIKILLEASDNNKKENKQIQQEQGLKFKLYSFLQTILSIVFVPGHLIQMNLMQKIDNNILHGKMLSGEKILAWIPEDENFEILKCVKSIKSKFPGVSFSDVVLTVFSETFYDYFDQKSSSIPPFLTTVILERAEKLCLAEYSNECCHLQNSFSVGMMSLPLHPVASISDTGSECETIEKLKEVNRETKILKSSSPEYQINYWLLKVVSKLLPEPILRPMLQSAHSTMVVSNIYGPNEVTICNGHLIKDFVFWIPHRGLTGIGISVLSYAGRLELGINIDKALISNTEDAFFLLERFVGNLKKFQDITNDFTAHKKVTECK